MTGGRLRRPLRALSLVLIVAGALVLVDAILTLTWQEPLTAFTAGRAQAGLEDDLDDLGDELPTAAEVAALRRVRDERARMAVLARSLRQRSDEGDAVARLRAPDIDLDVVVVQGTEPETLRKGPGMYDRSSYPGSRGTTAIAGHRTTYGAPFRDLDQLDRGDRLTMEMPYGTVTYAVTGTRIVKPSTTSVLDGVDHDRLVLTACHPKFSAAERIVVFARRTGQVARGPARRRPLLGPTLSDRVRRPSSTVKRGAGGDR